MEVNLSSTKLMKEYSLNERIILSGDIDAGIDLAGYGLEQGGDGKLSVNTDMVIPRAETDCVVGVGAIAALGQGSHAYGYQSFAAGNEVMAGVYGFRILSGSWAPGDNYFQMAESSRLSDFEDALSPLLESPLSSEIRQLSYKLEANYDRACRFVSADYALNRIYVDQMPPAVDGPDYGVDSETSSFNFNSWNREKDSPGYESYVLWIPDLKTQYGNLLLGRGAHAEGWLTHAFFDGSHAEGCLTQAEGRWSHAEGYNTKTAYAAHAEGRDTRAFGEMAHSEGYQTRALADMTHAAGMHAIAKDKVSWVWNGCTTTGKYGARILSSNGIGTFNVYPRDGLSGFYIGGWSPVNGDIPPVSLGSLIGELSAKIQEIESTFDEMNDLLDEIVNE